MHKDGEKHESDFKILYWILQQLKICKYFSPLKEQSFHPTCLTHQALFLHFDRIRDWISVSIKKICDFFFFALDLKSICLVIHSPSAQQMNSAGH